MFYSEKGISLFLVVVVLGVSLGIIVGASSLIMRQIATVTDLSESVVALHAADSGVEYLIYKILKDGEYSLCSAPCAPDTEDSSTPCHQYGNGFTVSGLGCGLYLPEDSPVVIHSLGEYRQTRRKVEVSF